MIVISDVSVCACIRRPLVWPPWPCTGESLEVFPALVAPGGVWGHNIGIISAAWCHSASLYIRTLAITDSDSGENSGGFVRNSHTSRNISHRLQFNCHLQKLIESIVYGP